MIVVVTGPICAGKSTHVAQLDAQLRDEGVAVEIISLDEIGHEVLTGLYGYDVDRSAIAAEVFADPEKLYALEATTHPRIMEVARMRAQTFLAQHPRGIVVIESPIPLSPDTYPWLAEAEVQVVDADRATRRERALGRGMSAAQFDLRDAVQQRYDYKGS